MENKQTDIKNVTINVMEKIGSCVAISPDQGYIISELIQKEFKAGHHVTLSFAGLTMVLSPFIISSYGTFLEQLSPEELEQKISLIDMSENAKELFPYAVSSAIRFYKNPEAYYEAQRIYEAEYYDNDGFDDKFGNEFDELETEQSEKVQV